MRKISLGYNAVPAKAVDLIMEVWKSGQFSPGPKVKEFEEKFAKLHKAKHAVFVNSGTDALRLGLMALKEKYGWKDGSLVAVPALTFVATVNVILQAGLKPFFVDVGMRDYCLNTDNLLWRLKTSQVEVVAVMPVHLFGQSCDVEIFEIAKERHWKVLEDSCETILNPIQGEVSCHSTYMAHHVTTGVGGFALTDDDTMNALIRSYANHGRNYWYIPGWIPRPIDKFILKRRFQFDRIGFSCRATEFEAALGLSQLDGLEENLTLRALRASHILHVLKDFDDLILPATSPFRLHAFMMIPLVLQEESKIDKYDLCLHLEKNGIETRDMMPITNQPCYKHLVKEDDFPVAKRINRCGFYIGVNPGMTIGDVEHIGKTFKSFFKRGALTK